MEEVLTLDVRYSKKYGERNTLSEKGFLQLPLPDDDPDAMLWLCKAFHMRQTLAKPPLPVLENMAVLCDKYDASLALSAWSGTWLSELDGSPHGDDRWPKILWMSYAFGNQAAFQRSSHQMVQTYTKREILETAAELKDTCLGSEITSKHSNH